LPNTNYNMSAQTGTLRDIIDQKAVMAKTKRLDLSFNELLAMYEDKELQIQPAFQRIFVWDLVKQSQFIESLLLELPVPPIYVVEEEEGQYVLVDGLQRLSTYFHFRGVLVNESKGIKHGQGFAFEGCDIAPELDGKQWKDLDTALQIRLKRAFVSVQVIRRESDPDLKFHMFKRLNDGGTQISRQQVRNCVVRMLNGGTMAMDFIDRLAKTLDYRACCSDALSEEQMNEQFDQELILRFFALKNSRPNFKHDVAPFIDEFAENIASAENPIKVFDYTVEEAVFLKTFRVLAKSTGELSFTFANKGGTELTRGFSAYHFEGVTLGLQPHLQKLHAEDAIQMAKLKESLKTVRLSKPFKDVSSGGGRNSPGPLNKRVELIEGAVARILA
jgi:hypothetical protein